MYQTKRRKHERCASFAAVRKKNMHLRAFTLVEVTISLALIALIGTMSISIVTFASRSFGINERTITYLTELRTARQSFVNWISSYDTADICFSTGTNVLYAEKISDPSETAILTVAGGRSFYGQFGDLPPADLEASDPEYSVSPEGKFSYLNHSNFIDSADFIFLYTEGEPSGLVKCTIWYNNGGSTYTFVYYLRAASFRTR